MPKSETYEDILIERYESVVGIVKLNRPNALNALSINLLKELLNALTELESDENVRCIIITGSEKAFCAGADISELSNIGPIEALRLGHLDRFIDAIQNISKPLIAAINNYCLGGGLELAMTCDILIAGENAKLGQPEINIGIMPGAGGTQRLPRAIGKYKSMDLILTGRQITAKEAYDIGLLSRVVPNESVLTEAKRIGLEISKKSPLAIMTAKNSVLKAFETSLSQGLEFERRNFYLLLGSEDKQEGMRAFIDKRKPVFTGK